MTLIAGSSLSPFQRACCFRPQKRERACACVCGGRAPLVIILRHALAQVVEVMHYKAEVTGSIPCGVLPAAL